MLKRLKSGRLRAVLGVPAGGDDDGVTTAAFTTSGDGFVAIVPGGTSAVARAAAEASLERLAEDLPAGSALDCRWHADGDAEIVGSGLGSVPALARAALAERVADAICAAVRKGCAR